MPHNTIIASGGVGSIYRYHTNSTANAGEIQGIIAEKGLALKDMEMMQFHPTVVRGTSFARKPLLSEALRGEGAYIVDENGYRFLFDYHKDGELATEFSKPFDKDALKLQSDKIAYSGDLNGNKVLMLSGIDDCL